MLFPVLSVGSVLPSGRIYPRAVIEAAVAKVLPDVRARRVLGEYLRKNEDYDRPSTIRLDRVSHVVTDLFFGVDGLIMEFEWLDGWRGREAYARVGLLKANLRGVGDVFGDIVQPGFTFVAIDMVERSSV